MDICVIYFKDENYTQPDRVERYRTLRDGLVEFNKQEVNFDSEKYFYPKLLSEYTASENLKEIGYLLIDGRAIINLEYDMKFDSKDQEYIYRKLQKIVLLEYRQSKINRILE